MINARGYTPKELAADIALNWIRFIAEGKTGDFNGNPEAFNREAMKQLRKLHNKILDKSGMDGLPLNEEAPEDLIEKLSTGDRRGGKTRWERNRKREEERKAKQ